MRLGAYMTSETLKRYNCKSLSSEFQNSCIPRKTSHEYILLSTFERKTAFWANDLPKHVRNRPFFRRFLYFGRLGRLIWPLWLVTWSSAFGWGKNLRISCSIKRLKLRHPKTDSREKSGKIAPGNPGIFTAAHSPRFRSCEDDQPWTQPRRKKGKH